MNQKWKNKIYKLGKLDDGNPIQQITRSNDKRQKETKKHGIKPDSKLDWKIMIVEIMYGGYQLM